uniref:PH domain-containing protein n=1 Tax=Sus scrofa TaxID=9823 RepID=A0A8D1T7Y7_PIG
MVTITSFSALSSEKQQFFQLIVRFSATNYVKFIYLGPDILTLVVGSDISRCPNTPWPTCRGYLHKRTHSGFIKGWRKRWFVLKHDSCLHYYRHKKDEGKCPPLEVIKLEGAEVYTDSSLGKPFVFNCVPQSGNRTFCLCDGYSDDSFVPYLQNHVWEDVTLHNSSLPPLAIKHPECLGLLHQLDRSTDTWIQHYCILKDGCLYFYASIRSTQASGGLYLQGYRVNEQTFSYKQSVIELKPPSEEFKTFYFCAENETENQRWITALKMSIKKWLPLHQAIQDFMNRPLEETRM